MYVCNAFTSASIHAYVTTYVYMYIHTHMLTTYLLAYIPYAKTNIPVHNSMCSMYYLNASLSVGHSLGTGPRRSRYKKRMAHRNKERLAQHATTKINEKKARMRKKVKREQHEELNERIKAMAADIKAGKALPTGPALYALHPCSFPSLYGPTNGKQTNNKRALRSRDYRFPEGHPLHAKYVAPPPPPPAPVVETIVKKDYGKKSPARRKKEGLFYAIRAKVKAKKTADRVEKIYGAKSKAAA